tara:strand:+ start:38 stop:256 length:219 start_codon:yes stop_codon:yes gene_type:complete
MEALIRKVIVGSDPKRGLAWVVGQSVGDGRISHIHQEEDGDILIFVLMNEEEYLWKRISKNTSFICENDLKF